MTLHTIPNSPYGQGGNRGFAAAITKAGSRQTYYTFRLLADRDRTGDAFKAYAYFRWLDDQLDCDTGTKQEKAALIGRQQFLLETCYQQEDPGEVGAEEQMLVDLIRNDQQKNSGMQIYLRNMMAVMAFDVDRCKHLISQVELNKYSHLLSSAVTELLFYVIGHKEAPTGREGRYDAVYGAHIVHMLRDIVEDIPTGYINIPREFIEAGQVSLEDLHSLPLRRWVFDRVKLARQYFKSGRKYISRVKNIRCRLAGYAYLARFEYMLKLIEQDRYYLRLEYPERKSPVAFLWMVWRVLASSIKLPLMRLEPGKQIPFFDQYEEG